MSGYQALKFFLTFSFLYLFTTTSSAGDTLYFKGTIKIAKNLTYNYSLRFTVSKNNQITGYSLSDPGGFTETKTKIYGTFDSVTNVLNFEEKSVLRSRVDLQKNYLCFVKAKLTLKKVKLIEMLSGKFIGIEPGSTTQCATGEIKLINTDMVKTFLKQQKPSLRDTANKATAQVKKEKTQKSPEEKEKEVPKNKPEESSNPENTEAKKESTITISDAKGKEFSITGNKIKLSIWDNGEVDGDKISILLNDKYILENYMVTFSSKIIEVTLSDRETDTIKIIALNEGNLPPNTAAIKIESKIEQYPIITKANLNEIRTIFLRKKNFP